MKGPCTEITCTLIDMLPCDTESALGKIGMTCQRSPGDLEKCEKSVLVKLIFYPGIEG